MEVVESAGQIMNAKIAWMTIRVNLEGLEPIQQYAADSALANHPDAKVMIQPKYAEVEVDGDGNVQATIRGRILTKAGVESKRHSYDAMALGHTALAREIAKQVIPQLQTLVNGGQS